MDILQNNILDICHNYYKYLMNLENVVGICIGTKIINKINTFEPCINILVEKKIKKKYLSTNNIIPKSYLGIKTDVIEVGRLAPYMGEPIIGKFRPLVSGCEILVETSKGNYSAGTLGGIVYKTYSDKKQYFLLSNNHVLCNYGIVPIGNPVIQTNSFKDPSTLDVVANLSTFIPIVFSKKNDEFSNRVDAAIAELTSTELISKSAFRIGIIDGVSNAKLNEPVRKVGAYSGLTEGNIFGIGSTIQIDYNEDKYIVYKDQILINIEGTPGDSGSLVFNNDEEAIGLLIGGNVAGTIAYANDINIVLEKLNVELYTY